MLGSLLSSFNVVVRNMDMSIMSDNITEFKKPQKEDTGTTRYAYGIIFYSFVFST